MIPEIIFMVAVVVSFIVTFFSVPMLIRTFKQANLTGKDVNKPNQPKIPEMGGLAIIGGFVIAILVVISLMIYSQTSYNTLPLFAALIAVLIVAIIGLLDDLIGIKQHTKTILPLFAAIPLVIVFANQSSIEIPMIGNIYLPITYPLVLIPLAVTVVSNLTNMLAGFNGLEAGLGMISCTGLSIVALSKGSMDSAILLWGMSGALLAFLCFNRYPARIFIGDVGTLSIGACMASAIIIGHFEIAGLIAVAPFLVDFAIKVKNRFPREIDFTKLEGGKLTTSRVVGLPSLILKKTDGMSEIKLVASIIYLEVISVLIAICVTLIN